MQTDLPSMKRASGARLDDALVGWAFHRLFVCTRALQMPTLISQSDVRIGLAPCRGLLQTSVTGCFFFFLE
jgi:hypothetical protein